MRQPARLLSIATALALFQAGSVAAEWTDIIAEAELAYRYDTNLNQAAFRSDQEWELSWQPRAELGRVYQLADNTRLSAWGSIAGDIHHRWSLLDAVEGDGHLSLFHKFGLGPAPWGRVFFSGGYKGVQDVVRSGPRFVVGAEMGKRFGPRFDARLSYHYTNRQGGKGPVAIPGFRDDVFDQQSHRVTIKGNFQLTEWLLLSGGFSYRRGDFDSNAQTNLMLIMTQEDVKAVAMDQVFGGWVYRLVGNVYEPFVGLNLGLSDHWSLDASYRYLYGESGSLSYANDQARLSAMVRW